MADPLSWFPPEFRTSLEIARRRFIELSQLYHPDRAHGDPFETERLGRIQQEITGQFQRLQSALELMPHLAQAGRPPAEFAAADHPAKPSSTSMKNRSSSSSGSRSEPKRSSTSTQSGSRAPKRPPAAPRTPPTPSVPPTPTVPPARQVPPDPAPIVRGLSGNPERPGGPLSSPFVQSLIERGIERGIELGFRWLERRIERGPSREDGSS